MPQDWENSAYYPMDEGVVREFAHEGSASYDPLQSIEQQFESSFDKMVDYADDEDEKYAIGYIRTSLTSRFSRSTTAMKRLYERGEQAEQEEAIKRFAADNGLVKFQTFIDDQISVGRGERSLRWLKWSLDICERKGATLLYCELGSIFRHSEFFALIRQARERGVQIEAIKDIRAVEAAQRQRQKPKSPRTRGTRATRLVDQQEAAEARHPILRWKAEQPQGNGKFGVPTKLFNTYKHLYRGVDPIYKFFLEPNDKDPKLEDPDLWKPIIAYRREIADDLNRGRYLTVEGYAWTKETVRKAQKYIFSKEFKEFFKEMHDAKERWGNGNEYSEEFLNNIHKYMDLDGNIIVHSDNNSRSNKENNKKEKIK